MQEITYTLGDDKSNAGYVSTVNSLAKEIDSSYDPIERHSGISIILEEMENYYTVSDELAKKIISNSEPDKDIVILVAGGNNWKDRIIELQKSLKKIAEEKEKSATVKNKLKFILVTERFNDGDTFEGIEGKLKVISQEKIDSQLAKTCSVKYWQVGIAAAADSKKMEENAKSFFEANKTILEESGVLNTNNEYYFYLGGRGQGFSKENEINIVEEYKKFAQKVLEISNGNDIIMSTNPLRTFTNLDGVNDFEPIEEMYKTIKEKLIDGQKAYIFSQKYNGEKERTPILKIITNEKIDEIPLEQIGSSYNWLLLCAKTNEKIVIATQEQQNFPVEALAIGIKPEKIIGFEWQLQNKAVHKILFEKIIEKGDSLTHSASIIGDVVKGKNSNSAFYPLYK